MTGGADRKERNRVRVRCEKKTIRSVFPRNISQDVKNVLSRGVEVSFKSSWILIQKSE